MLRGGQWKLSFAMRWQRLKSSVVQYGTVTPVLSIVLASVFEAFLKITLRASWQHVPPKLSQSAPCNPSPIFAVGTAKSRHHHLDQQ